LWVSVATRPPLSLDSPPSLAIHSVPSPSSRRLRTKPSASPSAEPYDARTRPSTTLMTPPLLKPSHTPGCEGSATIEVTTPCGSITVGGTLWITWSSSNTWYRPLPGTATHRLRLSWTIARAKPTGRPFTVTNRSLTRYPRLRAVDTHTRPRRSSNIEATAASGNPGPITSRTSPDVRPSNVLDLPGLRSRYTVTPPPFTRVTPRAVPSHTLPSRAARTDCTREFDTPCRAVNGAAVTSRKRSRPSRVATQMLPSRSSST
jgi:hypothetical protein